MAKTKKRAKSAGRSRSSRQPRAAKQQDAIELLKADHRQVEAWFEQFESTRSSERKQKLAGQVCQALKVHTKIEHEIFYPAFLEATEDEDFARDYGLELLVQTARLWRSLGHHDAQGRFRIDGVTGPDEYSAIADNNVYTNLMAQRNLRAAADAVARHSEQATALGVDSEEAASWRDAAAEMVVPYDEKLGVHPQAEGFTEHAVWDFAGTTPDQYPLLWIVVPTLRIAQSIRHVRR